MPAAAPDRMADVGPAGPWRHGVAVGMAIGVHARRKAVHNEKTISNITLLSETVSYNSREYVSHDLSLRSARPHAPSGHLHTVIGQRVGVKRRKAL
jgi:hypothetical protein